MNTLQAMKILDQVREGADYSEATITRALFLVGEIDEHEFRGMESGMRGPGVDCPVQKTRTGTRAERSPCLVG